MGKLKHNFMQLLLFILQSNTMAVTSLLLYVFLSAHMLGCLVFVSTFESLPDYTHVSSDYYNKKQ